MYLYTRYNEAYELDMLRVGGSCKHILCTHFFLFETNFETIFYFILVIRIIVDNIFLSIYVDFVIAKKKTLYRQLAPQVNVFRVQLAYVIFQALDISHHLKNVVHQQQSVSCPALEGSLSKVMWPLLKFGSGIDIHSLLTNERPITSIHLEISILIVFILTSSAYPCIVFYTNNCLH